jgi:dolichol-phosphate mannosyltransferase
MSGFFAVRPSVIKDAPLKAKGYKILLEVLVKGNYDRDKVKEVPITFKDREVGESKLGSKVIMNYIQHLIQLYLFPGSAPFFKFLFVGGSGMVVDIGILSLLLHLVGDSTMQYRLFMSISFIAAVTWNFIWNRFWTFNAKKGSLSSQYLKFFVVAIVAFSVRYGLADVGLRLLEINEPPYYQILTFGVILIVTIINYLGSKLWAFKK